MPLPSLFYFEGAFLVLSGVEVLKQYNITMQTSKKKATKQPLSAFRAFEINTPAILSGLL